MRSFAELAYCTRQTRPCSSLCIKFRAGSESLVTVALSLVDLFETFGGDSCGFVLTDLRAVATFQAASGAAMSCYSSLVSRRFFDPEGTFGSIGFSQCVNSGCMYFRRRLFADAAPRQPSYNVDPQDILGCFIRLQTWIHALRFVCNNSLLKW